LINRKNKIISFDSWQDEYLTLNLCGGKIQFIEDDGEDMMEILYKDGMLIDVGKPTQSDYYYITVVDLKDNEEWNHPIFEFEVQNKDHLMKSIQQVILKFR